MKLLFVIALIVLVMQEGAMADEAPQNLMLYNPDRFYICQTNEKIVYSVKHGDGFFIFPVEKCRIDVCDQKTGDIAKLYGTNHEIAEMITHEDKVYVLTTDWYDLHELILIDMSSRQIECLVPRGYSLGIEARALLAASDSALLFYAKFRNGKREVLRFDIESGEITSTSIATDFRNIVRYDQRDRFFYQSDDQGWMCYDAKEGAACPLELPEDSRILCAGNGYLMVEVKEEKTFLYSLATNEMTMLGLPGSEMSKQNFKYAICADRILLFDHLRSDRVTDVYSMAFQQDASIYHIGTIPYPEVLYVIGDRIYTRLLDDELNKQLITDGKQRALLSSGIDQIEWTCFSTY